MQAKMLDGSYGEPIPFDQIQMNNLLENPQVEHVEVFNNTPNEMNRRKDLHSLPKFTIRKKKRIRNRLQSQSRRNNR